MNHVFTGLIFGDHGTNLPKSWAEAFKKLGLTHLIVVSGSQVSLVLGTLYACFSMIYLQKKIKLSIVSLVSIGFYCLTGGGPSIFRAITMALILIGLKEFHVKTSAAHALLLTACIMIILNPSNITQLGCLLSFAATSSLIYGVPVFEHWVQERISAIVAKPIALALAPFFFTAPILMGSVQTVSLISILSNLCLVTYIEWLVIIGFFSTGLGLIMPFFAEPAFFICKLMLSLFEHVIKTLEILKIPDIFVPNFPLLFMGMPYIIFILFLMFPAYSSQLRRLSGLTGLACLIIIMLKMVIPAPYTTVTFFDVGQGDACLIETTNKKTILIDTGKRPFTTTSGKTYGTLPAKTIITPALISKGINRLDTIIITHFDTDHSGGLHYLMDSFNVGQIVHNGNFLSKRPQLYHSAINKNIPLTNPSNGRLHLTNHTSIHFFPVAFKKKPSENNASLVFKLIDYTNIKKDPIHILFTGDLEKKGEQILSQYMKSTLSSMVYKVGHHGSKTSSTASFLNQVNPKLSIISAGMRNRYGHPAPEVLQRLQDHPSHVLSTLKHGAIELILAHEKVYIKTYADSPSKI